MFNFGYITEEDIKKHNPYWPKTHDHPYGILITGDFEFTKADALLNLINHEPDIDNIYLFAKDPSRRELQKIAFNH